MSDKNNKFIIFPKLESKHINIIVFVLSSLFRVLIPGLIKDSFDHFVEKGFFKEICYFDMLTNFLGDISVGFYKLVTICKVKENKISTSVGVQTKKEMLKKFFVILPIIAFIDIFAQLCLYCFPFFDRKGYVLGIGYDKKIIHERDLFFLVGIDIFFRYIFSRILLKSYFYKHHYVSMFLTFIGFIPLVIINIIDLSNNIVSQNNVSTLICVIYIILNASRAILYSLEDVFNKIALNKLLLRPYELMFYKAVFQIFPIFIISIVTMSGPHFSNYIDINFVDDKIFGRLVYRLFFIIFTILRTIALITIIEKINPNHLSILKSMEFIVLFIYTMSKEQDFKLNPLKLNFEIFSCFILFLGSIIHNEMIIINKWKLYECTDYYKSEVKGFSNIDVDFEGNNSKNDKSDSLLGESI